MNKRIIGSLAIIVVLAAIIALALLSGVQNAPVGQSSLQTVSVQAVDPLYAPAGLTTLNVTYTSVGIHYVSAGASGWEYYNVTGVLDLIKLQNYTYTLAQFSVPHNATVDESVLHLGYANVSYNGTAQRAFVVNRTLYAPVSGTRIFNGSSTVLLDVGPAVLPLVNQSTLYFAVRPTLSATLVSANATTVGAVAPLSAALRHTLALPAVNITLSAPKMVSNGNNTYISVKVINNAASPVTLYGVVLQGNFSVRSTLTNASILSSIASDIANSNALQSVVHTNLTQRVNASGVASSVGSLGGMFNISGLSSSLSSVLHSGVVSQIGGALSNLTSSLHLPSGITATGSALTQINASAYKGMLVHALANATGGRLNTNYLSNQTVGTLTNIANGLGGLRNSSIEGSLFSSLVESEYNQYINRTLSFNAQMRKLRAMSLVVESSGKLVPPSTLVGFASGGYGLTLAPYQSATLTFNGTLTPDGGITVLSSEPGNTYKIIVSGGNTAASVMALST